MPNIVRLKQGALDYFRRLARKSPTEIQAYLVGEVVTPELTVVDSFEYPKEYGSSTVSEVSWYCEDYDKMQKKAEARGRRVVGFIHSHPRWDAVMSPADYAVVIAYGYRICGICSTDNGKTRTRFWLADSALPCEVEYAEA